MGNFASVAIRNSTTATPSALPSDAFVIDCEWLEATHPHFQLESFIEQQQPHKPVASTMPLFQRLIASSSWVCSTIISCRTKLHALVSKPSALAMVTTAAEELHDVSTTNHKSNNSDDASDDITDGFFDEFHQVFEPRTVVSKEAPSTVAPTTTIVKTVGAWNSVKVTKTKPFTVNNNEYNGDSDDDEDADDFEDCVSYTTDATDSLSESECEGPCFAFCGGLECEVQSCRANEPQVDTDCDSVCSDDDDNNNDDEEEEDGEDCLARAERLVRMASTCADFAVYLDDYLCQCGECPQYKLIAYEVQRYGTYANDAEKLSLTRILQAFSTYNEVVGYDCDMIPTAEECLQVWGGDEDQAFKSFVTLYDEVPHLCA